MKRASEIYVGANVFGLFLYAVFIMRIQYEMHAEQRHYADFGDSMTFALTALPVLVIFSITNASWAIWGSTRLIRHNDRKPIIWCALVIVAWVISVLLLRDFS